MFKIEIFQDDVKLDARTVPSKEGKPPRTFYEQAAYAHLSGRFPTQMKLQVEEGQQPYPAGFYTLHGSSFNVNNYGGLELKRFGQLIVAINDDC